MQVIERVMQTYGLLVTLTPDQQVEARDRLSKFLEGKNGDENALAMEGIKYLRGDRFYRRRS